jgi:DNA-binding LacI/PurR family transcriptional regulator
MRAFNAVPNFASRASSIEARGYELTRITPPSAHDVARLAGVSQAAVSRAFTPGASISVKTREKVLNAAEQLDYHPNHLAKSLITGKSGIVGVVIGNPRNTFHLEALDELSSRLLHAGRHLQVFTARTEGSSDSLVEALLRFRVDTLLLMSANLSPQLIARCQAINVPVIFFNRRPTPSKGVFGVTGANQQGSAEVAKHLLAQGYHRPAIITASENSTTSKEREAGFVQQIVAGGLPRPVKAVGSHGSGAIPAARKLLSLDPQPDAIFCTSDTWQWQPSKRRVTSLVSRSAPRSASRDSTTPKALHGAPSTSRPIRNQWDR